MLVSPLTEAGERTGQAFSFSEKDLDLLGEMLTPDWQDIPLGPSQGPGPDGSKPLMQQLLMAFPDIHVTRVLGKLNAEDRTQAVITALKRGLASLQ